MRRGRDRYELILRSVISQCVPQVRKGCVRDINQKHQGRPQVIQRGEMKWEDFSDTGSVSNFHCTGTVFSPSRYYFL